MPPLVGGPGGSAPSLASMIVAKREAVLRAVDPAAKEAAEFILGRMRARVARGVGVNERKFAPYRPATAKKKGRTQPVDLRGAGKGGHLMDGLYVAREGPGRYAIRLRYKENIARYLQDGTRKMVSRRWFGSTVRDSKAAGDRFSARLSETARRGDRRVVRRIVVGVG
jgi:hypothetical protein